MRPKNTKLIHPQSTHQITQPHYTQITNHDRTPTQTLQHQRPLQRLTTTRISITARLRLRIRNRTPSPSSPTKKKLLVQTFSERWRADCAQVSYHKGGYCVCCFGCCVGGCCWGCGALWDEVNGLILLLLVYEIGFLGGCYWIGCFLDRGFNWDSLI